MTGVLVDGDRRRRATPAPAPLPSRPSWRARLWSALPWLVAPIVAAVAVLSWYDAGHFVAAGDIGPFFREGLRAELGDLWGYGLTGAGSPSGDIARLPDVLVLSGVEAVGGSAVQAQMVFFWLWLTAAAAGAAFFVRQLVPSPLAAAVVAVLAVVNPLLAVNLPNPLTPAAIAVLGLTGGVLVRAAQGRQRVAATVVATAPAAYLAINPPTLLVVGVVGAVLAVLAARVGGPGGGRRLRRHLLRAAGPAVLVHLWWIVPTAYLYLIGGPTTAAVTDPEAWGWTHVNNSLPGVATLTAHWGWGLREYLPFSQGLDTGPLSWARYALPALALAAPFLAGDRRRRRLAVSALVVALGAALVAKGLHAPGEGVNRFLYDNVPGMWLLREPMSKLGPVLLGAYLVGVAVAVDGVVQRLRDRAGSGRPKVLGVAGAVAVLVVAAIAFGHPVVTGGVAPTDRAPLPSSRVAVPDAWTEAAAAIDGDPVEGKVLVLPTLPFYQATTEWGFHGVSTLPRDLLRRPVVVDLPGAYYTDAPVVAALARVVEAGDPDQVDRALEALGVSHVIVRRDLADAQAALPVADGAAIAERLAGTGVFDDVAEYGSVATVLRRTAVPAVTVSATAADVTGSGDDGLAAAIASTPAGVAAVDASGDTGVPTSVVVTDRSVADARFTVGEGGPQVVAIDLPGTVATEVRVADGRVLLDPEARVVIGDQEVAGPAPVALAVRDGWPMALSVNGELVPTRVGATVDLRAGDAVRAYAGEGTAEALRGWSDIADCNRFDDEAAGIGGATRRGIVRLAADRHSACTSAALPAGPTLLAVDHRVVTGDGARLCVHDPATGGCLVDRRLPAVDDWAGTEVAVDVPEGARLYLYAEADDGPAEVRYRDIEVRSLRGGGRVVVPPFSVQRTVDLETGEHEVALRAPAVPARLGAPSPVQDCNDRGDPSVLSAEVAADGAIELRADADTACVQLPVEGLLPGHTYEVDLEHRTVSGRAARWCLWLDGAQRCANRDQVLEATPDWTEAHAQITVPADAGAAHLYLYGDGQRSPVTTVGFRDIEIRPAAHAVVALASPGTGGPEADVTSSSGERHEVAVRGDGAPFVLSLRDTAHEGWRLEGLPDGATARPVTVDGYRQGWVVTGLDGEADLVARFAPARWSHLATWLSAVALLACALSWALGRWRARRLRLPAT